jgi:hypothetical protein
VQVKIRFDAEEAISELSRLNLISAVGTGYKACEMGEAFRILERHWSTLLLLRKETMQRD